MKKKYEKPDMYMESFEVAEFISTCDYKWTLSSDNLNVCELDPTRKGFTFIMFTEDNNDCTEKLPSNADISAYCYHINSTKFSFDS